MEALAARYYEPLLRFLYWLSAGDQLQAEDMVQETFLRMMRGIQSYDSQQPFKPWLYAIAKNILRNQVQQAETRLTTGLAEEGVYPDPQPAPDQQVEMHEAWQAIRKGLHQVPFHQREVIVLFFYEDLSQKEIAGMLGIPVGTVKSRISLGLKQLRILLEAHNGKTSA